MAATFLAIATSYIGAASSSNNPTLNNDRMDSAITFRRLRVHKPEEEERWVATPPIAASFKLMQKKSAQSSQMLHAAENDTPLPTAVKALIVLMGLAMTTGAIAFGAKGIQTLKYPDVNAGSAEA
ncbi:hypothetical protein GN958_ATG08861 [Phytophthora infestans]|uniref:Uncharacterized protein n=1 Tax=Phytophthora infestans TaxID=4787 RepID=A0A8S9URJ4_PHYIN|nr:hypothetical protein GN958_ATG08861 [Phytophthora infestans]